MYDIIKAKHGIEPSSHLVAIIPNGSNEDMWLYITSTIKLIYEPYDLANAIIKFDKLMNMLYEQREYERKRLKDYGDQCSMGKCAMSRIHLIDKIFKFIQEA